MVVVVLGRRAVAAGYALAAIASAFARLPRLSTRGHRLRAPATDVLTLPLDRSFGELRYGDLGRRLERHDPPEIVDGVGDGATRECGLEDG
jgi:hypothetical protein